MNERMKNRQMKRIRKIDSKAGREDKEDEE
jgi:hypothetical protein